MFDSPMHQMAVKNRESPILVRTRGENTSGPKLGKCRTYKNKRKLTSKRKTVEKQNQPDFEESRVQVQTCVFVNELKSL